MGDQKCIKEVQRGFQILCSLLAMILMLKRGLFYCCLYGGPFIFSLRPQYGSTVAKLVNKI